MNADALWTALGLVTFGVALVLVGGYLRREYRRLFTDNPRSGEMPAYELQESSLRRGAVMFLTAGTLCVVFGLAMAGNEAWRFLQSPTSTTRESP